MLVFKQLDDIPKARLPTHLAEYIEKLLNSITAAYQQYDPEDDGPIVIITPRDTDSNLCERLGRKWSESTFEGITYNSEYNCHHAVILANNQFATTILIPREAWLDPAISDRIRREIE